jgi:hypothetical protein
MYSSICQVQTTISMFYTNLIFLTDLHNVGSQSLKVLTPNTEGRNANVSQVARKRTTNAKARLQRSIST